VPGIIQKLLILNPAEARFATRGFEASDPERACKLERMLESFVAGYNTAVATPDPEKVSEKLHAAFDQHHVGFAFEGVGLYLAALDVLLPFGGGRLDRYFQGAGEKHDFIVAVGAGFVFGRIPGGVFLMEKYLRTLDPFIAWCIPCGYGFHEGFFKHKQFIDAAKEAPNALSPLGKQLFDSGLGRSMWWVKCGDPGRIRAAIDGFPEPRRAELWAGIGIAATYAGGVGVAELIRLRDLAGQYEADFLSGLPFAARLRQKAGNYSEITELACSVLLGRSTDKTADMAEEAADAVRSQVHGRGTTNAYALVRQHLVVKCQKFERVGSNV
jgi:hypothetical protein